MSQGVYDGLMGVMMSGAVGKQFMDRAPSPLNWAFTLLLKWGCPYAPFDADRYIMGSEYKTGRFINCRILRTVLVGDTTYGWLPSRCP